MSRRRPRRCTRPGQSERLTARAGIEIGAPEADNFAHWFAMEFRVAEKTWRKRSLGSRPLKPETLMLGYGYDPMLSEGSLKPPQFQTSTFVFKSAQDGKNFFATIQGRRKLGPNEEPGLIYSRFNNPNLEVVEDRLALWDEADTSLAFASGMAAISTALWAYLRPGDVILQSRPIYGGTETLIHSILPEFGVTPVAFEAEHGPVGMQKAA